MSNGWVTTFYSYKGGVGRTFLLANVGWLLARWGRRVLCLDWDLEAPGLHRYLAPLTPQRHGVLDLVEHLGTGGTAPWREWVEEVQGPWTGDGALDLMAAGNGGEDFVKRVQALRWNQLSEAGFEPALEKIRAEWLGDYDHVLVDSRTGITDVGGICAAQLPDLLVLAFTATYQSLEGAIDVAARARKTRARLPVPRGGFEVLSVPCRIHAGEEDRLEREWNDRFAHELAHLFQPWKDREVEVREYIAQLRVQEQARWSFGEQLPVRNEPVDDPLKLSYAFANVAALIDSRLDGSGRVARDRHAMVSGAAGDAGLDAPEPQDRGRIDVFISYRQSERDLAQQLANELRTQGLTVWHDQMLQPGENISEVLYEAREQSRAFVVLINENFSEGRAIMNEFRHIERRVEEDGATLIPVWVVGEALPSAPDLLQSRFGLFLEDVGSVKQLASQLARNLRART